jgi:hypothetical protein
VEVENNCRLLGETISDTMKWLPQCEKVVNKLPADSMLRYYEMNFLSINASKTVILEFRNPTRVLVQMSALICRFQAILSRV